MNLARPSSLTPLSLSLLLCAPLLLAARPARAREASEVEEPTSLTQAPEEDRPTAATESSEAREAPEKAPAHEATKVQFAPVQSPAEADEPESEEDEEEEEEEKKSRPRMDFEIGGYGDLQFAYHNYGENQNRARGSQKSSRLAFDTTRLVLAVEGKLPDYGIEAEAEVEFEHGGTGSAMELEYEEFGEFEQEVEKGGEVLVEELYLAKMLGRNVKLSVGRFYVAVGTLSNYGRPTDYLGTTRDEAETLVIPNTWDEMGIQARWRVPWGLELTAQLVNGLDSTGFSSQFWVVQGHQHRFELNRATDLAAVLRADVTRFEGFTFGASAYYGGTTRNRPKPDLVNTCDDGNDNEVAPCGYVSASLVIVDAHLSVHKGPWRAKGLLLWGHLENAGQVSQRNARLSNLLNVLRTPVGDNALAAWAELGFNVAPSLGLSDSHELSPFVRYDYADTMFRPRSELFDNPRFRRSIYTVGAAYTLADMVFAKLDFSHRRLGSDVFRPENTVRVSTGFVY